MKTKCKQLAVIQQTVPATINRPIMNYDGEIVFVPQPTMEPVKTDIYYRQFHLFNEGFKRGITLLSLLILE